MRRLIVALATVGVLLGGGALSAGTASAAVPNRPPLCRAHQHFDVHRHHCVNDVRRISFGSWFQRFTPRFIPRFHAPVRHFSPVRHHSPVRYHGPVNHGPGHGPVYHGGHR